MQFHIKLKVLQLNLKMDCPHLPLVNYKHNEFFLSVSVAAKTSCVGKHPGKHLGKSSYQQPTSFCSCNFLSNSSVYLGVI